MSEIALLDVFAEMPDSRRSQGKRQKYHIAPDALDVTLVSLTSEYLGSVHVHPNSQAICFVLGEKEGFTNAKDAYAVVDPHCMLGNSKNYEIFSL